MSEESLEKLCTVTGANSAACWIKYMEFYVQMAAIEKARGVAERALRTIFYRDEAERLKMWLALLEFECTHGTQQSLDDAFNKATQNW